MTPNARSLRSLTLPNRQWDTYTQEEIDSILDLKPDGLVILCFDNPSQSSRIVAEQQVWESLGRPPVILRPYAENILSFDPQEWATTCIKLWDQYRRMGLQPDGLIPGNEFNIEGGGEDWRRQSLWLSEFAVAIFRTRGDDIPLYLPALSPTGNYQDGWRHYTEAELHEWYPVWDAHCYTEAQLGDVADLADLCGRPIFVSEVNGMAPSFYIPRLTQMPFCTGAAWFSLRWIDPPEGSPNVDLLGGPYYYQDFKQTPAESSPAGTAGILGGDMDITQQYPAEYRDWIEAGGITDNFRKHLLGIGVLQPQGFADLVFLIEQAESTLQQLKGALARLPLP